MQGVAFTAPPLTTSQPCLPPQQLADTLSVGTAPPHQYSIPPNTAGLAKQKGKRPLSPSSMLVSSFLQGDQACPVKRVRPRRAPSATVTSATATSATATAEEQLPTPLPPPSSAPVSLPLILPAPQRPPCSQQLLVILPSTQRPPCPQQFSFAPHSLHPAPAPIFLPGSLILAPPQSMPTTVSSSVQIPYTTQVYRKKKAEEEKQGIFRRVYKQTATGKTCKKCGQPREQPSHQMYRGNYYCSKTAEETVEAWRARMQAKYAKPAP